MERQLTPRRTWSPRSKGATEAQGAFAISHLGRRHRSCRVGPQFCQALLLGASRTALLSDEAAADSLRERIQARDQFTLLFESTRARSEVSKIAGPWIAWKDKPHGGVFFCGALPNPIRHGELFEYPFELTPGEVLPVLLKEPVDAEQFGRAGQQRRRGDRRAGGKPCRQAAGLHGFCAASGVVPRVVAAAASAAGIMFHLKQSAHLWLSVFAVNVSRF